MSPAALRLHPGGRGRGPGVVLLVYALLLQSFFLPAQAFFTLAALPPESVLCAQAPAGSHEAPPVSPDRPCPCPGLCAMVHGGPGLLPGVPGIPARALVQAAITRSGATTGHHQPLRHRSNAIRGPPQHNRLA